MFEGHYRWGVHRSRGVVVDDNSGSILHPLDEGVTISWRVRTLGMVDTLRGDIGRLEALCTSFSSAAELQELRNRIESVATTANDIQNMAVEALDNHARRCPVLVREAFDQRLTDLKLKEHDKVLQRLSDLEGRIKNFKLTSVATLAVVIVSALVWIGANVLNIQAPPPKSPDHHQEEVVAE